MKKIKLFGLGNNDERDYFVFGKALDFFPLFADFLGKIGVEKSGSFYDYDDNSIDLEDLTDKLESMRNENYDIDIFYGRQKIIVVIRTEMDREYLLNLIKEFSYLES